MKKFAPYLAGIAMSLIFGLSFMFSKSALSSLQAFELLFLRFFTAAFSMTLLVIFKVKKVTYKDKNIKGLLVLAVWQPVLYFILETYGLKYSASSEVGILMALVPVIVTIMAAVMIKEKTTKKQWIFILFSVIGVVYIVLMEGNSKAASELKGIVFILGAVFSGALFNILSRKASKDFTPFEITYFMMVLGTIVFGGLYLINGFISRDLNLVSKLNLTVITSILYLGVMSSVVAFLLINYTLSKLPASQSAIFVNLTTVVSIMAGVFIMHDSFELYKLIGAVIIILGVWGTNRFSNYSSETK